MNTKDCIHLGVPLGEATRRATDFISRFILGGGDKTRLEEEVKAIIANPGGFTGDPLRREFARALLKASSPPRAEPVKYRQWGEGLEHEAVMQMERACLLPIGGVLATENTVIPYAVGVDIVCRMKMTVLDIPMRDLERHQDRLTRAIEAETRFGVGWSLPRAAASAGLLSCCPCGAPDGQPATRLRDLLAKPEVSRGGGGAGAQASRACPN